MRLPAGPAAIISFAAWLVSGAIIVAALYYGADVLIPAAASVLLAATLTPVVKALKRAGMPRVLTVLLSVSLLVVSFAFAAAVLGTQIAELARDLPKYEFSIRSKLRSLGQSLPEGGIIGQAAATLRRVGKDIEKSANPQPAKSEAGAGPPVEVVVQQQGMTPTQIAQLVLGQIAHPLAAVGLTVLLLIFLLLEHEEFSVRFSTLFGEARMESARAAFEDVVQNIGHYLWAMLSLNAAYGTIIGLGLFFLGVPNALLWSIVAAVLRLVPYAGAPLASIGPLVVSIAVGPGWTVPVLVLVLFISLEILVGSIVEPILYGSRVGLSPLFLLLAAAFWGSLWGIVGLVLSTPLTVCLSVLGRHVRPLSFISTMVGAAPRFNPQYERLRRKRLPPPAPASKQ